ncbi:hypothetical protein EVAR_4471_1 [Eumeta japonica]|uniref:Uncharacterized protein n=1 Tax=Eumeta variegata TaxID=151549 RepID=A0A4C1T0T3_EUMVA|nr:hypothetical protein EVAR_4471_1 [Eumeta japonica]
MSKVVVGTNDCKRHYNQIEFWIELAYGRNQGWTSDDPCDIAAGDHWFTLLSAQKAELEPIDFNASLFSSSPFFASSVGRRPLKINLSTEFPQRLRAAAVSLLLGRIGRWNGREIDASQAERVGRSCLSIGCSALSLARSAQAEFDIESCFFVRAAGVHPFL